MSNVSVNETTQKTTTIDTKQVNADPQLQTINTIAPEPDLEEKKRTVRELIKSPLQETVDMKATVDLTMPVVKDLVDAYAAIDVKLSDSSWKRKSKLKDCKEKFNVQNDLLVKQAAAVSTTAKLIPAKDAVKLSDKEIIKKYGEITTGDGYLELRCQFIRNKYYALIPEKELDSKRRIELVNKVRELYAADPRNDELIRYYQYKIAIKDYEYEQKAGENTEKNLEKRKTKKLPDAKELKKQNESARDKVAKAMKKNLFKTGTEVSHRMDVMKSVMMPSTEKECWPGTDEGYISSQQREGIREILAWMYRNCAKTSELKEPFVYSLTQAEPEKLLLMFYLIEHDLDKMPTSLAVYRATADYIPDLDSFKDKVVASKGKFWRRIGPSSSDRVIDWGKMGRVARYVLNNDIMVNYIKYSRDTKDAEKEMLKPETKSDNKKKEETLINLIQAKGNLLLTIYRSSGLTPDMPIELIEDKKLQIRAKELLNDFRNATEALVNTIKQDDDLTGKIKETFDAGGKEIEDLHEEEDDGSGILEGVDVVSTLISGGMTFDDALTSLGDLVSTFTEGDIYSGSVAGINAVNAVLGIVSGIGNAVILAKSASSLSVADGFSQALSVSGNVIGAAGEIVQGTADMVGKFVNMGETGAATWLVKDTVVRTAGQAFSTVAGGIQFCTGCVSIGAGALQTAGAGIQICRNISTRRDIKKSRKALKEAEKRKDLTDEQKADHKQLGRFLDHQYHSANDKAVSAAVSTTSGILKMAGGVLTVMGILAPLGGAMALIGTAMDIGVGLLYVRKMKRDTKRRAVDTALDVEKHMKALRAKSEDARKMKDKPLKEAIRQELLGALGYTGYKDYFAYLCQKNAELLYKHVFVLGKTDPDYNMYLDALKSIGGKIRIPKKAGDKPYPTVDVIYSKLME